MEPCNSTGVCRLLRVALAHRDGSSPSVCRCPSDPPPGPLPRGEMDHGAGALEEFLEAPKALRDQKAHRRKLTTHP